MSIFRSLSLEQFDEEFGVCYRSIFQGDRMDLRPFRHPEWQVLLLPYGSNMDENDFHALARAAEVCGDREIVLADVETIDPSEAAVVIPASYLDFERVKSRPMTNLPIMDSVLFGRSGQWGCIFAASLDDVSIVGGDSSFIASFVDAAGGSSALRARFLEFSTKEWSVREASRSNLLKLVGW